MDFRLDYVSVAEISETAAARRMSLNELVKVALERETAEGMA